MSRCDRWRITARPFRARTALHARPHELTHRADWCARPPHPANPPTKRPTVANVKQTRAFGVGVATQNLMDLDYRALPNVGLWCFGRLQADADRSRVLDHHPANLRHVASPIFAIAHSAAAAVAKWQGETSPVLCCPLSLSFQVCRLATDLVCRDRLGETQEHLVRV